MSEAPLSLPEEKANIAESLQLTTEVDLSVETDERIGQLESFRQIAEACDFAWQVHLSMADNYPNLNTHPYNARCPDDENAKRIQSEAQDNLRKVADQYKRKGKEALEQYRILRTQLENEGVIPAEVVDLEVPEPS